MLRVLFLVEGFTDIRFVVGLSSICELTLAVPSGAYRSSGLEQRIVESGARVRVHEIPGEWLSYQIRSFAYLIRHALHFEVILAQEILRGALSANLVGRLLGVPVANFTAIAPVEYFRCRRSRGQIGPLKAWFGEQVIRGLLVANSRLADCWLALGSYLLGKARKLCRRSRMAYYYGVDVQYYHPVDETRSKQIRQDRGLPASAFVVFFASRVSHEKDPETVIRAVALLRRRGLDAVILNLGGGYQDFVRLAYDLGFAESEKWVLGRPAAHPMTELADYYQTSDALAQASLEEGLGLSPLEALACGTPVVATAVGGLSSNLNGFARMVPRRDAEAMSHELLWIAQNPALARARALRGREFVAREWNRDKAFNDLRDSLESIARRR